jgi:hypothetical protein
MDIRIGPGKGLPEDGMAKVELEKLECDIA